MDRAPTLQGFDLSETSHRPEHEGPEYDYKEIAREVLARIDERLAHLEWDAPPRPAETPPTALRRLFALLSSAVLVAAVVWLWFHGDTAKRAATEWASRLVASSRALEEKAQTGAEPGPPSTANALVAAAPMQAATPPRTAADGDGPAAAPVAPEPAEQMRKVDRNVAGLAQAVNELRTALQQVSDNNAKAVEEVKARVDQLARTVVRAEQAEQAVQPKSSAPAPTPRTAAPAARNRRYAPTHMSPYDAEARFLR